MLSDSAGVKIVRGLSRLAADFGRAGAAFCLGGALMLAPSARAQTEKKVFDVVPARVRASLIKRLELFIKYRRKHDWGRLYDLYSHRYIADKRGLNAMSRAEFVKGSEQDDRDGRGHDLAGFKTLKARYVKPEDGNLPATTFIEGCGQYKTFKAGKSVGPVVSLKSALSAVEERGEWFFTPVVLIYACDECAPEKCE